jgi:hypothetical protein
VRLFSQVLFCLVLLGISNAVFAQGSCPPGYYEVQGIGFTGCNPYVSVEESARPDTGPQWSKRWGAVAVESGADGNGFGTASSMTSRRKAEKAATAQCKKTGSGSKCTVVSYYNQCGAVAWGDTYYSFARAGSEDIASRLAADECSTKSINCRVLYAACSYPKRIR